MQHRGTKRSKPRRVHGYRWYDWDTGRIDLELLAADAVKGLPMGFGEGVPPWLEDFPTELDNAKPTDLAKIDAKARTAAIGAMAGWLG